MKTTLIIILACLSITAKLKADYIFIVSPSLQAQSAEGVEIRSGGKSYPIVGSVSSINPNTADGIFLLTEENNSYRVLGLIDQGDNSVLSKLSPQITANKKISRDKLAEVIDNLSGKDVGGNINYFLVAAVAGEIQSDPFWDKYFTKLLNDTNDVTTLKAFIHNLGHNGKNLAEGLSNLENYSVTKLSLIINAFPYREETKSLYLEALKRNDVDLKFLTLDRLRGSADKYIIPFAKVAVKNNDLRVQWAGLMCLATALEISIEAPSLEEYITDPLPNSKRLSEALLK